MGAREDRVEGDAVDVVIVRRHKDESRDAGGEGERMESRMRR